MSINSSNHISINQFICLCIYLSIYKYVSGGYKTWLDSLFLVCFVKYQFLDNFMEIITFFWSDVKDETDRERIF